jgi:hypothetical protein
MFSIMKIFKMICLLMSLFSSCLLAQEKVGIATLPSSAPPVHHVGIDNYYKIGTEENPVTANEYCAFLNSEKEAVDGKTNAGYGNYMYFYDSTFMNCGYSLNSFWEHTSVQKNDCITRLNEYHFRYSVIEGRGDYIIDGLERWSIPLCPKSPMSPQMKIQKFNNWRKNPSAQDICTYLNDKIEGRDEDAVTIKNQYEQDIIARFDLIDNIALIVHDNQQAWADLQFKIYDEQERCLITFSMQSDGISFHEGPMEAVVVSGMEYYRPSNLKISTE